MVSPPARLQWVHSAAARPEAPERTIALAASLPTEMPTASPVLPLLAAAALAVVPFPVPSVIARTVPAFPDAAVAPAGPCCAIPIASEFPVDPDVAVTGEVAALS